MSASSRVPGLGVLAVPPSLFPPSEGGVLTCPYTGPSDRSSLSVSSEGGVVARGRGLTVPALPAARRHAGRAERPGRRLQPGRGRL